jgi:hypothetical protein
LERSRRVVEKGVVAIFWTCAVYYQLHQLFFVNPDVLPFFIQHPRLLDEMQLATRFELLGQITNDLVPQGWQIASHPSPAPLVRELPCTVVKANSNSHAAKMCAEGITEACITTEKARKIYRLHKLHSFGSPPMVFFGGITVHSAQVIREVYAALRR